MQKIKILTTCDSMFELASTQMLNRELLYNKDTNTLYIKYNNEMRQIGCKTDDDNIILNEFGKIALADNIHSNTLTVKPDDSGLVYKDNVVFANTTNNKKIILLFKTDKDAKVGTISGKLYEGSEGCTSSYDFSASVSGSRYINGSSNGELATYQKCIYKGEEYLGIQFNPNTTIYFSGFDYIPNEYKVNFNYTDADFETIQQIQDEASAGTVTETFTYENAISWEFDTYAEGLDDDHSSIPNTQYDLTKGLYINGEYDGQVSFRPDRIVNDDIGYIILNGVGKALRLDTGRDKDDLVIRIYFSSNAAEERHLIISEGDSSVGLQDVISTSESDVQILTQALQTNTTYYIGTSSSRIRIHKIFLIYKKKKIIEGWEPYTHTWEFNSIPENWGTPNEIDLGDNLIMYNRNGLEIYPNETRNGNVGYVVTDGTVVEQEIFRFENLYNNTTLTVLFTSRKYGSNRILNLYNSKGSLIASKESGQSGSGALATMQVTGLKAGMYYLKNTAQLEVWQIIATNAGAEERVEDVNSTDNISETIEDFEETGESGDPHNISLDGLVLTLDDLNKLAGKLKDSDKQIRLDLSKCSVADNAKVLAGTFNKCTSLRYIALPQGVESLGVDTFTGCMFLETVVLPDTITNFICNSNSSIFSGTRVRTIVLPKSLGVQSIAWNTFANSGVRHIVVKPDAVTPFKNALVYGSLYNTLDVLKVYMTPEHHALSNYSSVWEHDQYFNDTNDNTMENHILLYTDYDKILKDLGYGG